MAELDIVIIGQELPAHSERVWKIRTEKLQYAIILCNQESTYQYKKLCCSNIICTYNKE